MKYPYIVNKNGIWYPSGAEVPEDTKEQEKAVSESVPFHENVKLTKTDINRMTTADLQSLAAVHGMENAKELSGAELKKILIEKFGL